MLILGKKPELAMMKVRANMLTYPKRQSVLTANTEEPTLRITKRKHTVTYVTSDDDLLNSTTPHAASRKTRGPPKKKNASVKPPKPSLRTARALRVARAEVTSHKLYKLGAYEPFLSQKPISIDESSDNESERLRKSHKRLKTSPVASGDGTKPAIAKTNPIFASIYREASKDLKHYITLVDPFPDAVKQDILPRHVYNSGVKATIKSGAFEDVEVRLHAEAAFDGEWFASVR